jgi:thiaminase/transcriptional activator TenA
MDYVVKLPKYITRGEIYLRNPRSIRLTAQDLRANNLSVDPPPPDSLFMRLWNACYNIAEQTLNTDFIKGIHHNSLDPVKYGGSNVCDAYYCFKGANSYLAAASRADDPVLKAFLLKKYQSYEKYNQVFPTIWHIRDAASVVPMEINIKYAQLEADVASHYDPIMCLVVMLPCEYLWYWLSDRMYPPDPSNLYAPWINDNHYPDGAYAVGNYLETYQQVYGPIDYNSALAIYSAAMNCEKESFAAATKSHT